MSLEGPKCSKGSCGPPYSPPPCQMQSQQPESLYFHLFSGSFVSFQYCLLVSRGRAGMEHLKDDICSISIIVNKEMYSQHRLQTCINSTALLNCLALNNCAFSCNAIHLSFFSNSKPSKSLLQCTVFLNIIHYVYRTFRDA